MAWTLLLQVGQNPFLKWKWSLQGRLTLRALGPGPSQSTAELAVINFAIDLRAVLGHWSHVTQNRDGVTADKLHGDRLRPWEKKKSRCEIKKKKKADGLVSGLPVPVTLGSFWTLWKHLFSGNFPVVFCPSEVLWFMKLLGKFRWNHSSMYCSTVLITPAPQTLRGFYVQGAGIRIAIILKHYSFFFF